MRAISNVKQGIATLLFLVLALRADAQRTPENDVIAYRDSVDQVFADPELSILPDDVREIFIGIDYFAYDARFRVNARFKRIKRGRVFKMKTTTERLPEYLPYGTLTFAIDGKKERLTVYQNVELSKKDGFADYLFLPFTDETNGVSTYGGGRYLDLRQGDLGKETVLDFNRCYNPYCVYSKKYSCPIPPSENHMSQAIEAGVKAQLRLSSSDQ
jgi:uncharacterized protein (DUF1684 family)